MVPKKLLNRFLKVRKGLRPFSSLMMSRGFSVRTLCLQPAFVIYSWATGDPWDQVVNVSEMAEGDLARLILRTVDNLRHFNNLSNVFPAIAATSSKAIECIMQEPIISFFDA